MLEDILFYDNQIIIYLNSLGSKTFDGFWVFITNPISWSWLFILVTALIFRNYPTKKAFKLIFVGILTCVVSLILVELIKRNVARFRPIDNQKIKHLLRFVTKASNYSFVSGHSAFSMTFAYFVYNLLKDKIKGIGLIFIFPALFAYSRLYLGVHFLTDIISGLSLGVLIGNFGYKIAQKKLFLNSTNSESVANGK